jgi:hypothetical protein
MLFIAAAMTMTTSTLVLQWAYEQVNLPHAVKRSTAANIKGE